MRILITSPVFPPDLGGPAVYVPSVARFLVDRGHDVRVVAFCSDPEPSGYPFEVVSILPASMPVRYLKAFWIVLREARRAEVVYINEHLALLHVLAARLAGRNAAIRIMVDGAWEISHRKGWIDGDDINTFQEKRYGSWKVRLTQYLQRKWWGWCRTIVAPSDFLRQIPIRRYGVAEGKVRMIHNAYHGPKAEDIGETRADAREKLGLEGGARYLLTVCRLMVWKGVDGILRALERLPEDVHLLIAGEGPAEEDWKELARSLGLEGRAHFLGNGPYEKIPLYMRAADVFVLNSEYEGLSHTLLEVQAVGTPVVCTGVCGNPEVVEDGVNGLLVDPRSPEALAASVRLLLDDPALGERLASVGKDRLDRFSREKTFERVEETLLEVAAR